MSSYYRGRPRRSPCSRLRLMIIGVSLFIVHTAVMAQGKTLQSSVVSESAKYLDVRERTNHNDAPEIDKMLAYIGLPKQLSWCAAYVLTCYRDGATAIGVKQPLPKIGRVSLLWQTCKARELTFKTFTAEDVSMGIEKVQPADIPCWRHGRDTAARNFDGHTEVTLVPIDRRSFKSRGGNTVGVDTANAQEQRGEGGSHKQGVYDRVRKLGIGSSFSVVGFIRVR